MANANLRTYEPLADFLRGTPFFDMAPMFDTPRMRRALATMPAAPEIKMDVTEDPEAYYVTAEIPGVRKEDIHIMVEGDMVSITAEVERKDEQREGAAVLCTELYAGKAARTFTLMAEIDDTRAEAKYENGMLKLKLPKKAGAKTKTLTIA